MNFQLSDDGRIKMKPCSMNVKEVCRKYSFSVLEVELRTGRKHQIRSILSSLSLPIIGDTKYGSSFNLKNKMKLFAHKIEFVNLPGLLSYLNGKIFEIKGLKEKLIWQVNSSQENILPKKFVKY